MASAASPSPPPRPLPPLCDHFALLQDNAGHASGVMDVVGLKGNPAAANAAPLACSTLACWSLPLPLFCAAAKTNDSFGHELAHLELVMH
jgi:hypothetical protein